VALDVGVQPPCLVMEKRMRPAGRRNNSHAIWAFRQHSCCCRTKVETACRRRRWRIQIFRSRRLTELRSTSAKADHFAPIAIQRETNDAMIETSAVVVEICDGVQERMTNALKVQRSIRIAHIKALHNQPGRQMLSTLTMAAQIQREVFAFLP